MSDADEARKKRASIALAVLLIVLAVILTIIALDPDRRTPQVAPPAPTPTPTPSASPSGSTGPSPQQQNQGGSGAPSGGGGSSGVVCTVGSGSVACPQGFTIAGDASGLYPGATVELPLTLDNPYTEDIRVTSITVSVTGTSAPSCDASNLHTPDYEGPGIIVPAHGARPLSLTVSLSRSAPDGCQNVTFALAYAGKAESA